MKATWKASAPSCQRGWPPPNPFQEVWDAAVARATELASGLLFAGYHCTRLTLEERDTILRSGMVPLSTAHFEHRLEARGKAGDIPGSVTSVLRAKNYVNDGLPGRCLDHESGIHHFFRYWGGESLYLQHMADDVIGGALRSVGSPCIIEAALGADEFSNFHPIGYRLLRSFLKQRCGDEHEGWECNLDHPVPASQIRRIIDRSDPLFETLTGCSSWDEPLA